MPRRSSSSGALGLLVLSKQNTQGYVWRVLVVGIMLASVEINLYKVVNILLSFMILSLLVGFSIFVMASHLSRLALIPFSISVPVVLVAEQWILVDSSPTSPNGMNPLGYLHRGASYGMCQVDVESISSTLQEIDKL
ncbi:hypothetical protein L195_g036806 [Trifolium pratense]|uniref:Uncharacterized protein n=1 Tax=Trifolium pratense TaxID=57577 RepID=A0A2K3LQG7_TRIPR|nr:hypothetical protein L195_g036806 [Trifolium pratense]